MKAMIAGDLISLKGSVKSVALTALVVAAVIVASLGSIAAVASTVAACMSISLFYNLLAQDETNDWQAYRLTLPISRKQVVSGRYASSALLCAASAIVGFAAALIAWGVLLCFKRTDFAASALQGADIATCAVTAVVGFAISLLIVAATTPLAMKSGLTKAVRYLPLVMVLLVFLLMIAWNMAGSAKAVSDGFLIWATSDMGVAILIALGLILSALLYALSWWISAQFYGRREF